MSDQLNEPRQDIEGSVIIIARLPFFGKPEQMAQTAAIAKKELRLRFGSDVSVGVIPDTMLYQKVGRTYKPLAPKEVKLDNREALAGWEDPPRAD